MIDGIKLAKTSREYKQLLVPSRDHLSSVVSTWCYVAGDAAGRTAGDGGAGEEAGARRQGQRGARHVRHRDPAAQPGRQGGASVRA